jgi:hypothetical protein
MNRRQFLPSLAAGIVGAAVATPVTIEASEPTYRTIEDMTREIGRLLAARLAKPLRLVPGDYVNKRGDWAEGLMLQKQASVIFSPPARLTGKSERGYDIHMDACVSYEALEILPVPRSTLERLADQIVGYINASGMTVCARMETLRGVDNYIATHKKHGLSVRGVMECSWQATVRFDVLGA